MQTLYFVQSGTVSGISGGKVSDRARFDQNLEKVMSYDEMTYLIKSVRLVCGTHFIYPENEL